MSIITVGIDLAKNVFAVHGVDEYGKAVLVKPKVARDQLLSLIVQLPPCPIGTEACSGAHHWARLFRQHGHTVKLMAPKFVTPYRLSGKRGKNDAADAAAICEALTRPHMRFVPVKEEHQQIILCLHRTPANLKQAWRRVKSNHGAPGNDGLRIEDFPAYARDHWPAIRQTLSEGRYQPQPVRRVSIPKPGGGERALGIPTVVDRVIQQAIAQIMTPIFDPDFSESSYGFRPGRSAHGALKQIKADLKAGYRIAVDLDLAKFFDNVDHDILMARVARKISDKRLLALIGRYLRAGVMIGSTLQPSELGTPQCGPLSPLLANILLDDLDRTLEERGHRFARYADDLMVLVKSERAGQRVKANLTAYLDRQLKLPVNENKSHVAKIEQCVFLGFTFRKNKLRWSEAAFADFKHRLRELTGRSWGVSMDYRFEKLGQYLRGWMGYFGISEYYRPIPELDEWLRRRVRMCYWKQWRLSRTKISHLLALGVDKWTAIVTGVSGKSYWHLSRSKATQVGMTNDWLRTQGLVSIRDLWMKAHGYA